MKLIFTLLILSSQILFSQNMIADYYLDLNGNKINEFDIDLYLKYPDYTTGFRVTKDSGMVYQLNVLKYRIYATNYKEIKKEIELITNKKFSDSTIFIIDYNYFNDNCSSVFNNDMKRNLISERKTYFDPQKRKIKKNNNNIELICLFEKEIKIHNKPDLKNEYFFSDKNNLFRDNLFVNPTLCGSFGIIKPNGETLIRNGEYRLDLMAEHLKPEFWEAIFKK